MPGLGLYAVFARKVVLVVGMHLQVPCSRYIYIYTQCALDAAPLLGMQCMDFGLTVALSTTLHSTIMHTALL